MISSFSKKIVITRLLQLAVSIGLASSVAAFALDRSLDRALPPYYAATHNNSASGTSPTYNTSPRYGSHAYYGKEETGEASWYGHKYHGRQTANGDIYDMYKLTAAHKTLPFNSYAEITNIRNGRQVIVRINDRGDFYHERVIDLSYGAAEKLDMVATGTAQVRIRPLGMAPNNTTSQPTHPVYPNLGTSNNNGRDRYSDKPAPYTPPTGPNFFFVKAAAYAIESNALHSVNTLRTLTDVPVQVQAVNTNVGKIYRVWLGPVGTAEEGRRLVRILAKSAYPNAKVVKK